MNMKDEASIEEFNKMHKEREYAIFEKRIREFHRLKKGWKLSKQKLRIGMNDNGTPLMHEFDLVSEDRTIVGECKSYKWTKTGYYPSAKIS